MQKRLADYIPLADGFKNGLSITNHHTIPGFNLHADPPCDLSNVNSVYDFYQKSPFMLGLPFPCLSNRPLYAKGCDPTIKLVEDKELWLLRKVKLKSRYKKQVEKDSKEFIEVKRKIRMHTKGNFVLPFGIANMADHLSKDPDPYFHGKYDWTYGNTLHCCELSGRSVLLSAGGEKSNILCISPLMKAENDSCKKSRSDSEYIPKFLAKYEVEMSSNKPILEITSTNDMIGVRQRNTCTFFKIDLDADEIETISSRVCADATIPYVSLTAFDGKFCTIDGKKTIRTWKPHVCKNAMYKGTLKSAEKDKMYKAVTYTGKSNVLFANDTRNIYMFDERAGLNDYQRTWGIEDYTDPCEIISLMLPSLGDENYSYVGCTHALLLLDARANFVQKWTHMLLQAPSLGCAQRLNKHEDACKEAVILATPNTNEIVGVFNDWSRSSSPVSNCLPFENPSRLNTAHQARKNGVLYEPCFAKTFKFALVGLASYRRSNRWGIFSANARDDVFFQKLHRRRDWEEAEAAEKFNYDHFVQLNGAEDLEYLKRWEKYRLRSDRRSNGKKLLEYSKLVDFSYILDDVSKEDSVSSDVPAMENSREKRRRSEKWLMSKKELMSYNDVLAPHLLADFGLLDEPEWDETEKQKEGDKTERMKSRRLIQWLQNTEEVEVVKEEGGTAIGGNAKNDDDDFEGDCGLEDL